LNYLESIKQMKIMFQRAFLDETPKDNSEIRIIHTPVEIVDAAKLILNEKSQKAQSKKT
jgi:hypothetical protein